MASVRRRQNRDRSVGRARAPRWANDLDTIAALGMCRDTGCILPLDILGKGVILRQRDAMHRGAASGDVSHRAACGQAR